MSPSQSPASSPLQKQPGLSSGGYRPADGDSVPENVNTNTPTRGQVWGQSTYQQYHSHLGHLPSGSSFLSIKSHGSQGPSLSHCFTISALSCHRQMMCMLKGHTADSLPHPGASVLQGHGLESWGSHPAQLLPPSCMEVPAILPLAPLHTHTFGLACCVCALPLQDLLGLPTCFPLQVDAPPPEQLHLHVPHSLSTLCSLDQGSPKCGSSGSPYGHSTKTLGRPLPLLTPHPSVIPTFCVF